MGTLLANHNVFFHYGKEPVEIGHTIEVIDGTKKRVPTIKNKKYAECIISDEKGNIITTGKVRRYHKDRDIKLEARHQAFRKAVSKIQDRNMRKKLHVAFKENVKMPN